MNLKGELGELIISKDYAGITNLLTVKPYLANEGIGLDDHPKLHPLHRLCDVVFAKKITDEEAVSVANLLFEFGSNVNGVQGEDTPLIAAASLHAEKLAILYIEKGADILSVDKQYGGTALHWAAFCGMDKLLERLIREKVPLEGRDTSYDGTPLGWAIQALIENKKDNLHHQTACVQLLIDAGADLSNLNEDAAAFLKKMGSQV
jgi:hypothetical protein